MGLIRVFSGAVGIIQEDALIGPHGDVDVFSVFDTPTVDVEGKRKYLTASMAQLLKPYAYDKGVLAVLENVHSMPKQGVSSSFCFGEGKGMWEGILGAFDIPFDLVSPQRWKKAIMADQGKEKSAARFKAAQLFPSLTSQLSRVKDDGRAEAILMAEYGRRLR